jgi:hypothetical protein
MAVKVEFQIHARILVTLPYKTHTPWLNLTRLLHNKQTKAYRLENLDESFEKKEVLAV